MVGFTRLGSGLNRLAEDYTKAKPPLRGGEMKKRFFRNATNAQPRSRDHETSAFFSPLPRFALSPKRGEGSKTKNLWVKKIASTPAGIWCNSGRMGRVRLFGRGIGRTIKLIFNCCRFGFPFARLIGLIDQAVELD